MGISNVIINIPSKTLKILYLYKYIYIYKMVKAYGYKQQIINELNNIDNNTNYFYILLIQKYIKI